MHCSDGEKSSTRFRRRTCHSKITTYDEFDRKNAFDRVIFSFYKPGRTSYGHHEPEQPVLDDSAGRPAAKSRSNYSQEYGSSQSSQVWKSGNGEHDRSGRPEQNSWNSLEKVDPFREEHLLGRTAHSARNEETIHERTGRPDSENVQGEANFEKFIMGSDTTEFVNKVKNQVRIRQKRMSNVAEDCTEHSLIWGMFMATTFECSDIHGKSYSTMRNVVQNGEKITLKQMFDITAQTINNDEEVYCLDKIEYQRNTWTQLSLINDPVVIGLQNAKVYVFQILCYVSAKFFNILNSTKLGKIELQE